MSKDKIPLMLRLDEEIHAKIKCISANERRSLNSQVEYYIAKGIAEYEAQNGIISVAKDN